MTLQSLVGVELPIIQAPMAGVQGSALAVAVSDGGGLGSLPCALLGPEALRSELAAIAARTEKPYNVNFFCHIPPSPSAERESAWPRPSCSHGCDPGARESSRRRPRWTRPDGWRHAGSMRSLHKGSRRAAIGACSCPMT